MFFHQAMGSCLRAKISIILPNLSANRPEVAGSQFQAHFLTMLGTRDQSINLQFGLQ